MSTDRSDPKAEDAKISSSAIDPTKAQQNELTEDELKSVAGGACSGTPFKTVSLGLRKSSGGNT